jgi:hypothetical protein
LELDGLGECEEVKEESDNLYFWNSLRLSYNFSIGGEGANIQFQNHP